jgi:hypothetical protein
MLIYSYMLIYMPKSGIADEVSLYLVFLRTSTMVSIVTVLVYIPNKSVWGGDYFSAHILASICCLVS